MICTSQENTQSSLFAVLQFRPPPTAAAPSARNRDELPGFDVAGEAVLLVQWGFGARACTVRVDVHALSPPGRGTARDNPYC